MKTTAYICDYCNELKGEEKVMGIILREDMFDKLQSFPAVNNPAKCEAHYCLECYRKVVIEPAEKQANRKEDEYLYALKVKELGYLIRSTVAARYIAKKGKK